MAALLPHVDPVHLDNLIQQAENRVKAHMMQFDGSHDWWHIQRVRGNARSIAAEEQLGEVEMKLVDLSAMLHDVEDHKYAEEKGIKKLQVKGLLLELGAHEEVVRCVQDIIDSVSFSGELAAAGQKLTLQKEAAVVQDADRLDAIGALGIARTFMYAGKFNSVMYDPGLPPRENMTKEMYKQKAPALNHFHEKLLKLKDLMKTEAGKKLAVQRHNYMQQFLVQFVAEWNGQL